MFRRRTLRRMRRVLNITAVAVLLNLMYPTPTQATNNTSEIPTPSNPAIIMTESPAIALPDGLPSLADKPQPAIKQRLTLRSSAYSSTPDQTDGDPFTTASGTQVHAGTVATNCLPFGTKLRIPDYFGDTIFTVEDRMHAKWGCGKMDIWMTTRAAALEWGVRTVHIEILLI